MNAANEFVNKRVLIVGMARSGIAAAKLCVKAGALVTINDQKMEEAFEGKLDELKNLPITWRLGCAATDVLEGQDVLLISPGVPIDAPFVKKAREMGIQVTGELEFASRFCPCTLLALTGTNGKTTTVTLLGEIFRAHGKIAYVAGNVGYPLSAAVMEAKKDDVIIAEVSSFQLETTETFHPVSAAVLNVTEDHLNRHGTMDVYTGLKKHIFDAQDASDCCILNLDDAACRQMAQGQKGQVHYFSRTREVPSGAFVKDGFVTLRLQGEDQKVCAVEDIRIPGPHNLENALAATLLSATCGVPVPVIRHALRTFTGVEHRIEFVREKDGVRYINDSKGTNVDSTVKAIQSMYAPTVILLGGCDKHVSFEDLAKEAAAAPNIVHAVLLGETAKQLEESLLRAGFNRITHAVSMEDAVLKAKALSTSGGNVLLSPACASFDMFKDYEERGRVFKDIVQKL